MADPIYVIAFDIIHEDTNRMNLALGIQNDFPECCHIEQSVWLVETTMGLLNVKARLMRHLSHQDRLFISRIPTTVAAQALDEDGIQWLISKGVTVV